MDWRAVSSLGLGFAGVLLAWIPALGLVLALLALGLGILAVRNHRTGMSMASLFLSIVSVTVTLLFNAGLALIYFLG